MAFARVGLNAFWRKLYRKNTWAAGVLLATLAACGVSSELKDTEVQHTGWRSKVIAAEPQQMQGDADLGFSYMKSGAYVGSGLPAGLLRNSYDKDSVAFLRKSRLVTPHGIAFFKTESGVDVANGTCFTCHAGAVAGDTILGLGNSFADYRGNLVLPAKLLNTRMRLKYKEDDPEYVQYKDFGKYFLAMAKGIQTDEPGVNPAARIAETIMRYRDPQSLEYVAEPIYSIGSFNIATDTPPLWNVAKRNSLYYTAVGRGDKTKLIFQASVLGITDSAHARRAQRRFVDVLAWLNELEPPKYGGEVNTELAERGKLVFDETCSSCHGNYGAIGGDRSDDTYPNKVLSVDAVRTDPLYASYAVTSGLTDWYNASWFATSYPQSRFEPEAGYVAPPLDGIWASAPYLHNGSVPTIDDLLNSYDRPTYWERSGDPRDYDDERLGWKYTSRQNKRGEWTYDTTLPGYGNGGHTYGDHLSTPERGAVVEYLKTL